MNNNFFPQHVTAANKSNIIATNSISTTNSNPQTKDKDIQAAVFFLAPFCFMIFVAFVWLLISNFLKMTENKYIIFICDRLYTHPCQKCHFFNDNPYLRCAIHPSIALTEQALNCSDYEHR